MKEIWKDITGYSGLYQVSSNGRIVSIRKQKFLKGRVGTVGYRQVVLSVDGLKKTLSVHRLVATEFVENPQNKPYVNHIDGNYLNNNYKNLEFVTPQENSQHHIALISTKNKSSKYIGVCFCNREKKWISKIRVNGIRKSLGYYETEELAAQAYHKFAIDNNVKHRYSGAINRPA